MTSALPRGRALLVPTLLACLLPACKKTEPPVAAQGVGVAYLAADEGTAHDVMRRLVLTRMLGSDREVRLSLSHAGGDPVRQSEQVREALRRKEDYLIISPADPVMLAPLLLEARKAGTTVIGLGEEARDMPCDTRLWCDQKEIGRQAGALAVKALQRRAAGQELATVQGRVLMIRGSEDSVLCARRAEGFLEALAAEPGVILVHDAPGFWTQEGGRLRTEEALRIQRVLDVVYAHNDLMALGSAKALGEQRESVLVIGTDGLGGRNGGLPLVNEGMLDGTIYQPLLVDFAAILVARRMEDPAFVPRPEYELKPRAVTPRDLDDIRLNGMMPYPDP